MPSARAHPDEPPLEAAHQPSLEILYQDSRYIAIRKPAGLLTHRSPVDRRETRFAVQMLRDQLGHRVYPVHRLDRPTSGALVFGLDKGAMIALQTAFERRQVEKRYLAVTRGHAPEEGLIDYALRRFCNADASRVDDTFQESTTAYVRLSMSVLTYPSSRYDTSRYSLLELRPRTGRRHQLRRHLSHLNYPIIGDTRYGDSKLNQIVRARHGIHRLLLAAVELSFTHPFTGQAIRILCPPDSEFQRALRQMDLSEPDSH